jgi:geranylgeranyl diphosphate synthase type I
MTDAVRSALAPAMLAAIEDELRACLVEISDERHRELAEMVRHHFGWHPAGGERVGKRVRPLLTLLTASAAGGDWMQAVPAAASIELIHNFTLIHDDIEDSSETRRGRPTVWSRWGVPQAVNTGDFVYVASHLACHRLTQRGVSVATVHAVQVALDRACLDLTLGQHLDLAFERREKVGAEDYLEMISGKTAALLAAAAAIGAQAAEAAPAATEAYHQFGWNLGMAFQLLDDLLGIWGEPDQTGKSVADDLRQGKKSYPVLLGLEASPEFARAWSAARSTPQEIQRLQRALEECSADRRTRDQAESYTREAMRALAEAGPRPPAAFELQDLALRLLRRDR